jgi:hypothetical protein
MKTDLVLTMGEYLAMYGDVPKHVNPPGKDARHIPVTADVKPRNEAHGCRCDRWGHPCPGYADQKQGQRATVQDLATKK